MPRRPTGCTCGTDTAQQANRAERRRAQRAGIPTAQALVLHDARCRLAAIAQRSWPLGAHLRKGAS